MKMNKYFTLCLSLFLSLLPFSLEFLEPNYGLLEQWKDPEKVAVGLSCDSGSCSNEAIQGAKWDRGNPCSVKGPWKRHLCIPFVLDESLDSHWKASKIIRAMSWFRDNTCIVWTIRENEQDYVLIKDGKECYTSHVGKTPNGGEQTVTLNKNCYNYPSTVFHELMHALGFEHLQQRPDRDQYLEINKTNITPEGLKNYQIKNGLRTGQTWDYDSVMLYGSMDFQRRELLNCNRSDCYTVTKKGGGYLETVFAKPKPSRGDYDAINKYYNCDSIKVRGSSSLDDGYLDD